MIWLRFIGIAALITGGILLIAFLEDKLVSAPRRRQLEKKARERLAASKKQE